jgi:hypothetical protein
MRRFPMLWLQAGGLSFFGSMGDLNWSGLLVGCGRLK